MKFLFYTVELSYIHKKLDANLNFCRDSLLTLEKQCYILFIPPHTHFFFFFKSTSSWTLAVAKMKMTLQMGPLQKEVTSLDLQQ